MVSFLNEIAQNWWDWMSAMIWQVSLLIVIISAVDILIRRWVYPQIRYALWLLVLIKLIIPPDWTNEKALVPNLRPLVESKIIIQKGLTSGIEYQPKISNNENIQTQNKIDEKITKTIPFNKKPDSNATVISSSSVLSWKSYLFATWFLGMIVFAMILYLRIKKLRRWHNRQIERKSIPHWFHILLVETAKRIKLNQLPAIVFSEEAVTPAVYGIFRPVLLLPKNYTETLSKEEAEHILLHELAHLKRRDLWLHGLTLFLQIIYWFNPLLIWVRKQIKHVREICCDLTIANYLRDKTKHYRQTLLNTARELLTETVEPGMGLLGVFEEPFRLVSRIKWLEKETWETRKWMYFSAITVSILLFIFLLPMGEINAVSHSNRNEANSNYNNYQSLIQNNDRSADENIFTDNYNLLLSVKQIEPVYAAILPMRGSYDRFKEAYFEMKQLFENQGIKPTGFPFARYFSNPKKITPENYYWEIGFPVKKGTEVNLPLEIIQVYNQQVASATIIDVEDTKNAWDEFVRKMKNQGILPAFPPAIEIFKGDLNGEFWRETEMQMQAVFYDEKYPGLEIEIKDAKPIHAIVLPVRGSYSQFTQVRTQINEYVSRNNIQITGDQFGRFFSNAAEVASEDYLWEIGYPVKDGTDVEVPYKIRQLEGITVASAIINSTPEPEFPWVPMILKLIMKGYVISGPAMEIYIENEINPQVEMRIPVIQIGELSDELKTWGEHIGNNVAKWAIEFGKEMEDWGTKFGEKKERKIQKIEPSEFEWDKNYNFQVKESKPFFAIVLPYKGPGTEIGIPMSKVQEFMQRNHISPESPSFILQYTPSGITPENERLWEVGYIIDKEINVPDPYKVKKYKHDLVAYTKIEKTYDNDNLNQHWAKWFYDNAYEVDGPVFLFCPDKLFSSWRNHKKWEIHVPMKKHDKPFPAVDIYTKWTEPMVALILPMQGSPNKESEALEKLNQYLAENNIKAIGDPFYRYYNDPKFLPEDELLWDVGIAVEKGTSAKIPFKINYFPEELVMQGKFECSMDELDFYWYAYACKTQSEGYFVDGVPMRFIHGKTEDGKIKNEIQYPVRKKKYKQESLPVFY